MIEMRKIHKYFPANGVKALDGADFDLREGEIHALVGENGAGKSTLMHIMSGFLQPGVEGLIRTRRLRRSGHIFIDEKEKHLPTPAHAIRAGIGMVRQHAHLVPDFSVWENCILGSHERLEIWINRASYRRAVAALNDQWKFDLPLDKRARDLTVSQQQKAAILSLLLRNVRYFIFDEPTAVLTEDESRLLFDLFVQLKNQGNSVALISHKLNEITRIADRLTVLRRGKTTAVLNREELAEKGERLSDFIFGPEETEITVSVKQPPVYSNDRQESFPLELNGFTVNVQGRPLIRGVDLTLRQGMILGIAGVRDSGLETLELAVSGALPSSGSMRINGREITDRSVRAFREAGGAYLGTRMEGTFLSVLNLLSIHSHRRLNSNGILNRPAMNVWARTILDNARVAQVPLFAEGSSFSGGQLQRILLMREYMENTPLLVLAEPGRGLDRRFRKRLAIVLRERAASGTGILIFSTDREELLAVSDAVMVLRNGRLSQLFDFRASDTGSINEVREQMRKAMVGEA